ncbi:MAG: PrsW family intramembrane metalloprotease [Chloroflexi bacterium]|nr:PrsW family intramembrane metalloprotease [Chloroflexota bacterium]
MHLLGFLMLGFAPGIFWLWLIYQRDKYIPAPIHLVVRTFLWGIAVAFPVAIVEAVLIGIVGVDNKHLSMPGRSTLVEIAYISFIVAGGTEELAKYLVIKKTVFDSPYLRQPLDGIIFSAAAALGFASIENVLYIFSFRPAVILVRGPFSTLAHMLFSVTFGYALGARKMGKLWPQAPVLTLIAAMTLHGLFDYLLLSNPYYRPWALVLFLALAILFFPILRLAQRQSPYRGKVAAIWVSCANCTKQSGYGSTYCTACGFSLASAKSGTLMVCGQCHSPVGTSHHFCISCGSRLDRKLVSADV